jgi:hypothetical protein
MGLFDSPSKLRRMLKAKCFGEQNQETRIEALPELWLTITTPRTSSLLTDQAPSSRYFVTSLASPPAKIMTANLTGAIHV